MTVAAANRSVVGLQRKAVSLVAGMQKDLTPKQSLTVIGKVMTQVQIIAQIQAITALYTAVDDAKSALKQQEQARADGLPAARLFIEGLEAALKAQFGIRNPQLEDFGIGIPGAKTQRTAEQKAISAAKARQTREAHGIMGKKQRAAITVAGSPGVTLVSPTGQAMPGLTTKPTPPADLSGMTPPVVPTAPGSSAAPAGSAGGSTPSGNSSGSGTPAKGSGPSAG